MHCGTTDPGDFLKGTPGMNGLIVKWEYIFSFTCDPSIISQENASMFDCLLRIGYT